MRPRFLALLALALLVAPAAVAQLPPAPQPQGCGPLAVEAPVAPSAIEPGATGTITMNVRNSGQSAMLVTIVASTTAAGWSFPSGEEQTVQLAQGADQDVVFEVLAPENGDGTATVNFASEGACQYPGGQCPALSPQLCQAQGAPQTVTVERAEPQGFRIPGLAGIDIPLPYLIAGLLLIALAVAVPLLMRNRKPPRATATCPEPMKPVKPGKGASFPIEVTNPSDASRKLHLEVGAVPEGWSAFLPLPEIQLAAKESRSLWLMVRAPPDARPGQSADVEVTATDAGRPERPTIVKVRAEVEAEA